MNIIDDIELQKIGKAVKRTLKKRKLSYNQLAELLEISEASVKRLLNGCGSLTLSRINMISEWLGLSIFELFKIAEGEDGVKIAEATIKCEEYLAKNPRAFAILYKLGVGLSIDQILSKYEIEESELRKILRELEEFGLLKLMPHDRIRMTHGDFLQFNKNGPVNREYFPLRYQHVKDNLDSVMPIDFKKSSSEKEHSEQLISFYLPRDRYLKFLNELDDVNQKLIDKYTEFYEDDEDRVPLTFLSYAGKIDMWEPVENFLLSSNRK